MKIEAYCELENVCLFIIPQITVAFMRTFNIFNIPKAHEYDFRLQIRFIVFSICLNINFTHEG